MYIVYISSKMASALSEAYSFPMLSRLPPASFVVEARELRPDIEPNGGVYPINTTSLPQVHLRGATNEVFLLNHATLAFEASMTLDYSATPIAAQDTPAQVRDQLFRQTDAVNTSVRWTEGPILVDSSRESFNSGSLPLLDNQDSSLHSFHNNMRCLLAKRNARPVVDSNAAGAEPSVGVYSYDIDDLASAGWNHQGRYKGINAWYRVTGGPANTYRRVDNGVFPFQAPLGLYSSIANTTAILPAGLLSSYAVNGMSIQLRLPDLVNAQRSPVLNINNPDRQVGLRVGVPVQADGDGYRNVRIVVPVVRILDPAVMNSILSLYEKRESVNVGGVQFPLSLRLNTIGHRFFPFPLQSNQGDFYFRIPITDRSVRAIAWGLFDNASQHRWPRAAAGEDCPVNTRLEVRVGSNKPTCVIEDRDPYSRNLAKYYSNSAKRSGHCFSPFPFWMEAQKRDGLQSDLHYLISHGSQDTSVTTMPYGVISLENMDYKEGDLPTCTTASGVDCTGVGGIDIQMRFNHFASEADAAAIADYQFAGNATASAALQLGRTKFDSSAGSGIGLGDAVGQWQICFIVAYDTVMEVSPSGVADITNAVL